ncbi:unnamed protein product, partial [Chrysoparadoxa australica]
MKNRFLSIALVILVVLNLGSLSMLWFTNHSGERPDFKEPDMESSFFKDIDFNEQQKKRFRQLSIDHRKSMRAKFEEMGALRLSLFTQENLSNDELSQLLQEINRIQRSADSLTFVHFKEDRDLCVPDQ